MALRSKLQLINRLSQLPLPEIFLIKLLYSKLEEEESSLNVHANAIIILKFIVLQYFLVTILIYLFLPC